MARPCPGSLPPSSTPTPWQRRQRRPPPLWRHRPPRKQHLHSIFVHADKFNGVGGRCGPWSRWRRECLVLRCFRRKRNYAQSCTGETCAEPYFLCVRRVVSLVMVIHGSTYTSGGNHGYSWVRGFHGNRPATPGNLGITTNRRHGNHGTFISMVTRNQSTASRHCTCLF